MGPRILVVGDVMLDEMIFTESREFSGNAAPILRETSRASYPGGAANAAANVVSLGGRATLVGVVGADPEGERLESLLGEAGVDPILIRIPGRPTTRKTRIRHGDRDVFRLDREETAAVPFGIVAGVLEGLAAFDAILLSDYAKGVLTAALCRLLLGEAVPSVVDPKPWGIAKYLGCTVATPNLDEAPDPAVWRAALPGTALVRTCGADGVEIHGETGILRFPSEAGAVVDPVGAGDTLAAALVLGLASGLPLEAAVRAANRAAGRAVERLGTSAVDFRPGLT